MCDGILWPDGWAEMGGSYEVPRHKMSDSRNKRELQELRDASEHLLYEFWMLDRVASLLAHSAFGEGPVRNALLESFTMHARVLLQFFFPKAPRPDDVLAEDYFGGRVAWETVRGTMPVALSQIDARVGKEVAHLTYARLSVADEAKAWKILEIAAALSDVAAVFSKNVNAEALAPHFPRP
jgi:hypothetical protein